MTKTGTVGQTTMVEYRDPVATVILNRPEKLNALTKDMWRCLGEVFVDLDQDGNLHCIVLRGAGTKAIGVGADISEFEDVRANRSRLPNMGPWFKAPWRPSAAAATRSLP